MTPLIRPIRSDDIPACGRILHEAFLEIARRHQFRPDFPSTEVATLFIHSYLSSAAVFGVVAEISGTVVGSNFLAEQDPIRAVGPITIDPTYQGRGLGRRLMQAVIEKGRGAAGIRLVQDAFNTTSLSLYSVLGFDVKEPLAVVEGTVKPPIPDGIEVRLMKQEDLAECGALCEQVLGVPRINELKSRAPTFPSFVAIREGHITAYASAPHFWPLNHAVAISQADMESLLAGAAAAKAGPLSILLPTRQTGLFRWCLSHGMRTIKPMTLMAQGQYRDPSGCYLPSVGY